MLPAPLLPAEWPFCWHGTSGDDGARAAALRAGYGRSGSQQGLQGQISRWVRLGHPQGTPGTVRCYEWPFCWQTMESEPWHRGSIRWMSVLSDVSIYERRTRYAIQCRVDSRRPSDEKRCAASQRSTRPHQLWLRAHLPCSRTVRGWGSARFVRFVDDVASPNLPQRHFAIRRPHFNTEDGSVAIGNRSPRF